MTGRTAALARLLSLAIVSLSFTARGLAHGPAPGATALLGLKDGEASLVRLSRGLAQRVPDGFRFVCPETWGGDVTAPAAAIPNGPALIASERLFVVTADGRVSPHPNQVGEGIALASNQTALYGLFRRDGQYELQQLGESTSDLVRVLDEPFGALAAEDDDELSLLGWSESTLVLQSVSLSGELRARVTWNAPSDVAYAELRSAHGQLYVVIWGSEAPWVTLGRVTARGYESLREAHVNIAGPVAFAAESVVLVDGMLAGLEEGASYEARGVYATCLGDDLGQAYACVRGDLIRVDEGGLTGPLFELSSLREPDYDGLEVAASRRDCATRWQDLRVDIASLASSSSAGENGVSADAGTAGVATSDAAVLSEAGESAHSAGCTLGPKGAHAWWLHGIVLGVLGWRTAIRRSAS